MPWTGHSVEVAHFETTPDPLLTTVELLAARWFLPRMEPFQERIGGRIALVAEINIAGTKLVTYNLHLESRANNELRLSQVEEALSDAARQNPQCPLIIAGDFNLDDSKLVTAAALATAGFHDGSSAR